MMETGLFVRKAQQSDIPAILEIEWECFREDSFSKEQFAYLISRSKGTFYVMMEGDRVIAYVSLLFHGGTHYLRIYSIAVHPDFRGKGLGQALMDQTIRTANECKAAKITLEVKVTNAAAIALYMKNGLIPVGCQLYATVDSMNSSSHEISFSSKESANLEIQRLYRLEKVE